MMPVESVEEMDQAAPIAPEPTATIALKAGASKMVFVVTLNWVVLIPRDSNPSHLAAIKLKLEPEFLMSDSLLFSPPLRISPKSRRAYVKIL